MRQARCIFIWVLWASASTVPVAAGADVVSWVDADGVTHFGDRMFAPAEHAVVDVKPVNGMEPASYGVAQRSQRGPAVVNLSRTHIKNKRGFRGYAGRAQRGSKRRRR
jgi:hypothetical protein